MTLVQLVPTLEVCQQLQKAGFPQNAALTWYPVDPPEDGKIRKGDATEFVFMSGECEPICAAPTAGELEEWLMDKGYKFRCAKNLFGAYAIVASRLDEDEDNKEHHPYDGYNEKHVAALAALCLEVAG